MAIKDWTRTAYNKGLIVYDSNIKNVSFIISSTLYPKEWEFSLSNTDSTEFFKIKSQALRYAKAYMRKH